MEYNLPLCNTTEVFSYSYYFSLFTLMDIDFEDDCLSNTYANSFATYMLDAKFKQINIHDVAFEQQHLSLY